MSNQDVVLNVRGLHKTYRTGFWRKRVEAVKGITFDVRRGETFGLLGPNGAGKTTTIKTILGLVFPTRGQIELFGRPRSTELMRKVGYLPESAYIYQYLRADEFLDLCGRLCGMPAPLRRRRTEELLNDVGLSRARDRPVGKFSKGMLQRLGLAQTLLHDPELLVLDEPMSGLDPIGRREVRELIIKERARGKTILFTSHILSDVERLCDRVAILQGGEVSAYGPLSTLLKPEVQRIELEFERVTADFRMALEKLGGSVNEEEGDGARLVVIVEGDAEPHVRAAVEHGARLTSFHERRETLEDLFVRDALRQAS